MNDHILDCHVRSRCRSIIFSAKQMKTVSSLLFLPSQDYQSKTKSGQTLFVTVLDPCFT